MNSEMKKLYDEKIARIEPNFDLIKRIVVYAMRNHEFLRNSEKTYAFYRSELHKEEAYKIMLTQELIGRVQGMTPRSIMIPSANGIGYDSAVALIKDGTSDADISPKNLKFVLGGLK
jgi:hypothetical protein